MKWLRRYQSQGIEGLYDLPRSGRPPILDRELESKFINRVQEGAIEQDGVTVLKAKSIRGFLASEFGVGYSLSGVYDLRTWSLYPTFHNLTAVS